MSKFCGTLCILGVIIFVNPSVQSAEEKRDEGLVAYYTFDEGTGTVALDKSGNKNDGTIHGDAKYIESGKGHCLKFDGVDDYVDCGTNMNSKLESAGTLELWYNPEAPQGGLVTWCAGGSWTDQRLILAFASPNKSPQWCFSDGNEIQNRGIEESKMDVWVHLVLTYNGEDIHIYKNGLHVQTAAQELTPNLKGVLLKIGWISGFSEAYFKGMIDEVRIYNRALSDEEIKSHYEKTKR